MMRSYFKTALFVVNENNRYLFRLRKDVSFLNKPILKAKVDSGHVQVVGGYYTLESGAVTFLEGK